MPDRFRAVREQLLPLMLAWNTINEAYQSLSIARLRLWI